MLLDAGCEKKARNRRGENAFLLAVRHSHANVVNLLLRHKVDCKSPSKATGETPLHIATRRGEKDLVNTLLRNKQGWSTRNNQTKHGYSALHFAARTGSEEIVAMLIEANASIDPVTKFGWTPLMWAACNGHAEVCHMLLRAGADKDLETKWLRRAGVSARVVAAESGHVDIIRLLMSAVKVKPRPAIEVPFYLLEEGQSGKAFKF
jgi:ankyrin repeat protein